MSTTRIGIDLGGSKIEACVLSPEGREHGRRRIPTPRADYQASLRAIVSLVEELAEGAPAVVGCGIPGAISPATSLVKNANSTWLIGRAFDRDLAKGLGRPLRVANDANCFVLSEARDGAAKGYGVVFGVILGTGVGGGLYLQGGALVGQHAIAGEWGHNPLPWPTDEERPGPACYCGKAGCVETWLSGPGMARDHRSTTGEQLDAAAIVARAEAGDASCQATMERYIDRLARSLAQVINIVDPEVIVLGGGLSQVAALYAAVPERLGRYVFSDHVATPIVPPKHGDASGVRGAAMLWSPEEAAATLEGQTL